ncbi:strigolactone esterase D14 [Zea mays]|uniref:Alpha/beta-Hydrolases superfamily protein n=1 Tax=Zea mays TaxID=4577 RepID=A0A1D6MEA6_MAIZE|nr:strigolactone esterase D14 [Zea mays]AQK88982.1 alpha/beta-Hydrolases superfamily protein [Zea mays]|eukprot:XP_008650089.1 strigolactone esterase D14 [Zea mays]
MRWYANAKEVGGGGGGAGTVVLAHGYGANQTLWDKLLPALSQHHRVILFDWDFTGEREEAAERYTFGRFADDLIALMDDKGVRGAVVVGHSMSAMVACIASARRPDLFAHLVLLCASPRYLDSPSEGYVGGFDRASIDAMLAAMESDLGAWVRGFVPNAAGADPSATAELEQSFLSMHPRVALEVARMIFLCDQRGALDAVAAPCTVVQVSDDFAAAPAVAEYMRGRMKRAAEVEVVVIDSVGHFPQLVAPQQLLAVLKRVLQRAAAANEERAAAAEEEADGGIDVTA